MKFAMKLDKTKLPKILSLSIGGLLALVLLFIGFRLVQGVFAKASDSAPREVVITSIAQNTAKIGWSTDQETQGVIEYGTSPTALNFFAPESQKGKKHNVDLTLLSPNSTYYFQIRIGDQKYDNGGVPWTFTTKSKGSEALSPTISPTLASTLPTPSVASNVPIVRPTSSLVVKPPAPTSTPYILPTLAAYVCGETDCIKICQKIGKTCSSQDWMRSGCVGKVTLSTCTQIAPTNTPAPTATTAPTSTPTSTPISTPTSTPTSTPSPTPT